MKRNDPYIHVGYAMKHEFPWTVHSMIYVFQNFMLRELGIQEFDFGGRFHIEDRNVKTTVLPIDGAV